MTKRFDYDGELRRYHLRLCEAAGVGPDDHVLDIGCGTGLSTRDAARRAIRGSALGIDISPSMVEDARRLSAAEGLHNVHFEQADAEVHAFEPAKYTLGLSRFGTMFFAYPVAAFTNIGRALRPGARLVQLVWQADDRQEFVAALDRALGSAPAAGVDPFSLGDPAAIEDLLTAAGFTDVDVADVREPVWYGADPDAAVEALLALRMTQDRLDAHQSEEALDRLRAVMAEHYTAEGVWLGSRAWLVTALSCM